MTGPLYRLGRFCARHHYPVIAFWVIAAIAIIAGSHIAGDDTNDNLTLPGSDSTKATDLLDDELPEQANGTNPILMKVKSGKLTDSDNKDAVDATVKALEKTDHVEQAVSPFDSSADDQLSKDKTIGYVSVTLDVGPADLTEDEAKKVFDAADPARDAGMEVAAGSYLGQTLSKPKTESSEAIGLAAAVLILLFAFGTVTAMALPIVTAVLGLATTLGVISLLSHVVDISTTAPTLATMIGLGVGIDYALFIVTRHKLQLRDGMEVQESVARATATAGGAVFFAGGTVIIALLSLLIADIPLVSSLGVAAAIAVAIAVCVASTLLPALLGALGLKINSLRVKLGRTHPDDHHPHGWERWARGVAKRPWATLIASLGVLIVLALPVRDLYLGQQDNSQEDPSTTARKAYDLTTEGFGAGENGPLLIAVKLDPPAKPDSKSQQDVEDQQQQLDDQQEQIEQQAEAQGASPDEAQQQAEEQTEEQQEKLDQQKQLADSPASDPRLTDLEDTISKTDGVDEVSPASVSKDGTAAVFNAVPTTAPSDQTTTDLVNHLRDDVIPKQTEGQGETVYVGGATAGYIDLADRIGEKLPSTILIVVGLSFIVLLLAFRSVTLAVKAGVCNLISVAAAYGIVTAVFQKGWGAELIGLDHAIPIVSFVPLLMFAILFGLSMDYEVFLLTQIKEHYEKTKDTTKSVIHGIATTGRVITSAALIMVCVFASFVLNGDPTIKEFGVGLAVAIAIDATIVRCMLVPAVMILLGKANWWMPRWLDRILPKISIEGEEYFRALDKPGSPRDVA